MKTKHVLAVSAVVVMGWLAGSGVFAATYNWNVGNGEFTNSASWNPAGPPGGADSAVFNQGPANNVTVAQSLTNAGLSVSQGNVMFNLQGNTYAATNNNPNGLVFGLNVTAGVLTVTNGTLDVACQQIGGGGNGTVTVAGPGALLKSGYGDFGGYGGGALNITGGGTVNSGGTDFSFWAPFTATISGAGSTWISRDYMRTLYAPGTFNILDGGQLILSNYFNTVGGGVGSITVSGSGSQIYQVNNNTFLVGIPMVVSNSANVLAQQARVNDGLNPLDSARLTVDGATMTNLALTTVGMDKNGVMVITNGGRVYSQFGYNLQYDSDIAAGVTSTGSVTVVGAGSRWDNTHNLSIGGLNNYYVGNSYDGFSDGGVGRLTVGTGAVVTAGRFIRVGSKGTLDLDGGTLGAQALTLQLSTAKLIGSGTINATVTNNGVLSPGHSAGLITVSSNLVLNSTSTATFDFDSASSFDQVNVGQSFAAGGVLNLQFNYAADTNNFTFFKIFDVGAGTGGGSFSQINWLGTPPQGGYRAGFIGNDFVITAIPEPNSACLLLAAGLGILALHRRQSR